MSDIISFQPQRAWDKNGKAVSGALATFFQSGTTEPVTVYSDIGETVPHPSPLVANSRGVFAPVYRGGIALRVVVTDPDGVVLPGYPIDPTITVSAVGSGAGEISFTPTAEIPVTNVQAAIERVQTNSAQAVSPDLTGTPTAPTAAVGTNTTQIATTAFVQANSGLQFIESQDASASATLDFTGFNAALYDAYVFEIANLIPTDDGPVVYMRTSSDGGATYDSGASDYSWSSISFAHAAGPAVTTGGDTDDEKIYLGLGALGNAAGEDGFSATVKVVGPHLAKKTVVAFQGTKFLFNGTTLNLQGGGARLAQTEVDAVRFYLSAGTIASGTITMYGLRNS
jgi:hypothetical protein